jgi:hypothetical protein
VLVGTPYNFAFTVTGTPVPSVTVDNGELPPGLTLSSAGVLSGTPTTAGIYSFALRATNGVLPDASTPVLMVLVNEAAGTVTEVVGAVSIIHADLTVSTAVVGSPIRAGDVVQTSATGAVAIRFVDGTSLAVSESAQLKVDEYLYDAAHQQGSIFFSFSMGIFNYISGLIGQNNPDNVHIETLSGGGGIRGTEFIATVDPEQNRVQFDLIHGQLAMVSKLTGTTTIIDAPRTAVFDPSGLIRSASLPETRYALLKEQVSSPLKPRMTATKSNSVGGRTQLGVAWTWTIHVANAGDASAFFGFGPSTVLIDQLPGAGVAYGTPLLGHVSGLTGTITCSIVAAANLVCTPTGVVEIAPSGSFDVVFTATPLVAGTYANPRVSGICGADPFRENVEKLGIDGGCSDAVVVARPVTIDIKPGASPNPFNCGAQGSLPVAILATATFDPTTVDLSTVRLAGTVNALLSPKSYIDDVNKDGYPDLVLYFNISAVAKAIGCPRPTNSSVAVQFTAIMTSGISIMGSDSLRFVK